MLAVRRAIVCFTFLLPAAACGGSTPPTQPTPPPAGAPVANAYILPGAVALANNAFGDEPVVIFKGEQMRWRNFDSVDHDVVTDRGVLPEFMTTGRLAPGAEQTFVMNTVGTTTIHCSIHPQMVGTLIVREK